MIKRYTIGLILMVTGMTVIILLLVIFLLSEIQNDPLIIDIVILFCGVMALGVYFIITGAKKG